MKLSYYGYIFTEIKTGKKFRMSIKDFIRSFCQYDKPDYKNQFTHNGENLFLLSGAGSLFLFIQTRSNEVIKKINSTDTSIGEIYDLLKTGEMIGFASYVYLMDSYIGFASTTFAPRVMSFANLINDVLQSLGVNTHQFNLVPFLHQASKAEALSMPFIGKSVIQINKSNSTFDHMKNIFGGTTMEFEDVDSIEITIKPKSRKNIEKAVKRVLSSIPEQGVEKMIVKAKDEDHATLVDLYLAGKGLIADKIGNRDEKVIAQTIQAKINENEILKLKVAEHEQDEAISQISIDTISKFNNVGAWASVIPDL